MNYNENGKMNPNSWDESKRNFYENLKTRKDELEEQLQKAAELDYDNFNTWMLATTEYQFLKNMLGPVYYDGKPQFDYNGLIHLPKFKWTDSEGKEHIRTFIGTKEPSYYGFGVVEAKETQAVGAKELKSLVVDGVPYNVTGGGSGDVTKVYVDEKVDEEKQRAMEAEAYKLNTLLTAPGSKEHYHIPFHMVLTPEADKVTAKAYTVTLDNNETIKDFDFPLPAATTTTAGVMSASDKTKLDGIDLTQYAKTTDVTTALNTKMTLLGDEEGSGGPYHFPYHMTLTPAADKITATAYTITLDNNKSLNEYSFDLPAATTSQAGIMTAADKTALNNKVDKTTTDSQLYGTKKEGGVVIQTTIGYSNTPNPSHIVKYDNTGRVRVDNTNLDASGNENCATPVSYVKTKLTDMPDGSTIKWVDGKLAAQLPPAMQFQGSKDYVSEVFALTTHNVGDVWYAQKDDRSTPKAEAPTVNALLVFTASNAWVFAGTSEIDLTKVEKIENKTTTISASSTETQYPSAKAVYDYGNPIVTAVTNLQNNKQDKLTTDQLAACNSGITSTKVGTYDGYATSKQDKIDASHKLDPANVNFTTDQSNALSSGITSTKVNTYDGYATKFTYQTTAPTAAISDNGIHIVYLTTEPTTKYAGYIYFIK